MDKRKIALLCNGYGFVNRGAEQFTYQFYNHLNNHYDIDIYGIGKTDHSIQISSKTRDDFKIPWRNGKAYLESYFFGKKLVKKLITSKTQYDLLFNNAGLGGSYWCNKYRKKTQIPFITRARGGGKEEKINYFFKPNCMVFLTKENERNTTKAIKKRKTIVIPNAIDISTYNNLQKKPSPLIKNLERPIFLGTSAFVKYKRNHLIINAIKQLEKGSLLLLGNGPLKNKTITYANEQLKNRFKYGGVISYSHRDEMINIYKNADVFVQAARKEAFGVVFLEAMAAGLPIVTQKDERREEIIGNAGMLINCSNITEFSNALKEAEKKKWNTIPQNQAKKYDWNIIKKQYAQLIENIIEKK